MADRNELRRERVEGGKIQSRREYRRAEVHNSTFLGMTTPANASPNVEYET
jgi:hypothetical protein